MNCFRSLYLWVDLQLSPIRGWKCFSCELLSFFVPLGWFTAKVIKRKTITLLWIAFVLCTFGLIYSVFVTEFKGSLLWIAFVLCTFGLIYSRRRWLTRKLRVVNCFRSLYLWVDLQQEQIMKEIWARCELLSFFVPLGWFTACRRTSRSIMPLWIAFVLCTFGLIYSFNMKLGISPKLWIAFVLCTFGLIYSTTWKFTSYIKVVNCFRSLYLWVDLQLQI